MSGFLCDSDSDRRLCVSNCRGHRAEAGPSTGYRSASRCTPTARVQAWRQCQWCQVDPSTIESRVATSLNASPNTQYRDRAILAIER